MFGERLPVQIDPLRFAESGRILEGTIPLSGMKRLADLLLDNSGEVKVKLEFGIDEEGIHYLHGQIVVALELMCQRCLGAMNQEIDSDFSVAFVPDDKAESSIPAHYEPYLLDGELVYLQDMIEDELILAIPIIPKHTEQCVEFKQDESEPEVETESATPEESPFAVLSSLKK